MDLLKSPSFSSHIQELLHQHHVPGLAVALVYGEKIVSAGFGKASIDTSAEKGCTADTLFDIASSSKSLTAAAVALLVDDDENFPEVKWDALMCDLLPEDFVMEKVEYTKGVTVEDILSHRTGIPGHDDSYMGIRASTPDSAKSVTRNLRNLPIIAPIRSKFMYCNMMYTVATHLIEKKTGLTFNDFLHERFFRPLGMTSTNCQLKPAEAAGLGDRIAMGHSWDDRRSAYRPAFKPQESPEDQGAGSIITSVNDYILYVKALMHKEAPFTETMYEELIRPRSIPSIGRTGGPTPLTSHVLYALGWEISNYRGYQIIQHDGLISGYGSRHFFLPELKFGGVLFGNSGGGEVVASIIAQELIDEVMGVANDQRIDWNVIETRRAEEEEAAIVDELEDVRQKLCPGIQDSQPLSTPLSAYVGAYHHPGYHTLRVQIKNDGLFIDATDRSMGFYLRFEHLCEQIKFVARLEDVDDGGDDPLRAVFEMDADGSIAVKMGLHLEIEMEELIWFERVRD